MQVAAARRITAADVAREAGVSRTTVSYVLNGTPHQKIPEATRDRVLAAAARLDYAPSAAARSLRSGRTDVVIGLLPDWPIGPAMGALLERLSTALADEGLTLLAHPRPHSTSPTSPIWRTAAPAAVVFWDRPEDGEVDAMRAAGIPVTVALITGSDGRPGDLEVPQQRAGRMQVEHLAATGHRRLGYAAPDDPRVKGFADPRLTGARTACADLGLDEPVVATVPVDPAAAAVAVTRWREAGVTGVCAYNDDVALAVLAGLREHGLTAPDDMAVIGVDDIPAAAVAGPPLTTVVTDSTAVARYIARTVASALSGGTPPRRPGSDIVSLVRRASA